MENQTKRKVAIIGGGIGGLLSASYAVENGLVPTIFEKGNDLGGNWSITEGQIWPDLITNVSRFATQFTDFVWSDISNNFPSKTELYFFIKNYIETFDLEKYVKFNTLVTYVELLENKNYKLKVVSKQLNKNITITEEFDYVMVCSGNYAIPKMIELEKYITKNGKIQIIHSSNYKYPEAFRGKRVVVVGNANSGVEIASEVSRTAISCINVFRRPVWVIKKQVFSNVYNKYIPVDLLMFNRNTSSLKEKTPEERNLLKNIYFSAFSEQNDLNNEKIKIELDAPFPGVSISDWYVEEIKKGLINLEVGTIDSIDQQRGTVKLSNGKELQTDVIILCTGFKRDFSFLDPKILKIIEFNENKFPNVILHKYVYHPALPTVAFIAIPKGFFCFWEMQVKLAFSFFLNKHKKRFEVLDQIRMRNGEIRYTGSEAGYTDEIADELGIMPNFNHIKEKDSELYEYLVNGPIFPQHYGLSNLNSGLGLKCAKYIKKLNRALKRPNQLARF